MTRLRKSGFSLAELILSLGFVALAILSVLGLSLGVMRTDHKALERAAGTLVAEQIVERLRAQLLADEPAGFREHFLHEEHNGTPWDEGSIKNGKTIFYYSVRAISVVDTDGNKVGASSDGNRLKKVDVHVWWAGEDTQTRQGSGQLEVRVTQLISEASIINDAL